MTTLENYINTLADYITSKKRQQYLENKKAELWQAYFGVKSINYDKDISVSGGSSDGDKMIKYLTQVEETAGVNGLSIAQELNLLESDLRALQSYLRTLGAIISKTEKDEYTLIKKCIFEGKRTGIAIKEFCEEKGVSEKTAYNIYAKVKNEIATIKTLIFFKNQ